MFQFDWRKGGSGGEGGYFSMVDLNMASRWWGGIVNYCSQMNFSHRFSCGRRGENRSVDEIRLSLGGERFHLECEVIALIEVAFITLTYYMSKWASAPSRRRYENIVNADASIGVIRKEMIILSVKGLWGFDWTLMFCGSASRWEKNALAKMGICRFFWDFRWNLHLLKRNKIMLLHNRHLNVGFTVENGWTQVTPVKGGACHFSGEVPVNPS